MLQRIALVGVEQVLEFAKALERLGVLVIVALDAEGVAGVPVLEPQFPSRLHNAVFGEAHRDDIGIIIALVYAR